MALKYNSDETASEEEVPPSQEGMSDPSQEGIPDFSQGYEIAICVYPDGYRVKGPNPLPQQDDTEEERIPDLATALKHVIALHKEHPMDEDMQAHFEAGYDADNA